MLTFDPQSSLQQLSAWLAAEPASAGPRISRFLAVLASCATGQGFLEETVRALHEELGAASIFIAHRLTPDSDRVRVVAALRDGAPREPWEYSLRGNPCLVPYRGQPTYLACDLAGHYENKRALGYESFIGVPLIAREGQVFGHLAVYDREPFDADDPRTLLLSALAGRLSAELEREVELQGLARMAATDPLTGLLNLRGFDLAATQALGIERRARLDTCVLAIDLDHFKAVNDTHGHGVGDAVIVCFAECLRAIFQRDGDVLGRVGGDEFMAVISLTGREDVGALVAALRARFRLALQELPKTDTGCSVGIVFRDDVHEDLQALKQRADTALYEVKKHRS